MRELSGWWARGERGDRLGVLLDKVTLQHCSWYHKKGFLQIKPAEVGGTRAHPFPSAGV